MEINNYKNFENFILSPHQCGQTSAQKVGLVAISILFEIVTLGIPYLVVKIRQKQKKDHQDLEIQQVIQQTLSLPSALTDARVHDQSPSELTDNLQNSIHERIPQSEEKPKLEEQEPPKFPNHLYQSYFNSLTEKNWEKKQLPQPAFLVDPLEGSWADLTAFEQLSTILSTLNSLPQTFSLDENAEKICFIIKNAYVIAESLSTKEFLKIFQKYTPFLKAHPSLSETLQITYPEIFEGVTFSCEVDPLDLSDSIVHVSGDYKKVLARVIPYFNSLFFNEFQESKTNHINFNKLLTAPQLSGFLDAFASLTELRDMQKAYEILQAGYLFGYLSTEALQCLCREINDADHSPEEFEAMVLIADQTHHIPSNDLHQALNRFFIHHLDKFSAEDLPPFIKEQQILLCSKAIKSLKITNLNLHSYDLTDETIKILLPCYPSLTSLALPATKISDATLSFLATLENLRESLVCLDLQDCKLLTNQTGESLACFKNLETLRLGGAHLITDQIGPYIEHLTQLTSFTLTSSLITSEFGKIITRLPLQSLYLDQNNQLTADIGHDLSDLKNLEELSFSYCDKIYDEIAIYICELPKLKQVNLTGCYMMSIKQLKRTLKNVEILH